MGPYFTSVFLTLVLLSCVCTEDNIQTVLNVKVGGAVTFRTGHCAERQILWTFGHTEPNMRIVKVSLSEVQVDTVGLRTRAYVEPKTRALTISNLTQNDSGVYQQQCIGANISSERFKLNVYNLVASPFISIIDSPHGGCHPLTLQCSVDNSRDLTLTWFRGKDRLRNISRLDLSNLTLSVEVEHSDTSRYVCEAQNPVDKKSSQFNPNEMCLKNGESSSWCHSELMVRLVLSAIVGFVLLVLVVDHLRIRK